MLMLSVLLLLVIGILLLSSGIAKLTKPRLFAAILARHSLPSWTVPLFGTVIGLGETVLGLWLLTSDDEALKLAAGGVLLLVFGVWSGWILLRQGPVECGCLGGFLRLRHGWFGVSANILLGLAALAMIAAQPSTTATPPPLWFLALLLTGLYWLGVYAETVIRSTKLRLRTGLAG